MGDRRQSRELALQALFFWDMNATGDFQSDLDAFCQENEAMLTPTVKPFFLDLVQGVIAASHKIDPLLKIHSKNWKVSRMPVVDRWISPLRSPSTRQWILQKNTGPGIPGRLSMVFWIRSACL